jgi:hypothetical protein
MANFAAADLDGLVRIVKRKLKKIQYRPHLVDDCLAATGLRIELSAVPLTREYLLITYSVCSE